MHKLFIALVVLVAIAFGSAVAERKKYDLKKSPADLFAEFQADQAPSPTRLFKSGNMTERFEIFKANLDRIKQLNEQHNGTTEFNLGKFSMMTTEEFVAFVKSGLKLPNLKRALMELNVTTEPSISKREALQLPVSKSWRRQGIPAVSMIKDQGTCGSCWSFAAIANIESVFALSGKGILNLAEQQFVDCERSFSMGCNGGHPMYALQIAKNTGVYAEGAYPYKGVQATCKAPTATKLKITSFTTIPATEADMKNYLATKAPLIAFVDASTWQHYSGGILTPSNCGTQLDHAILITGYGTAANGATFWEIKNSWGTNWGENGFLRISRRTNTCGIYTEKPYSAVA